MKHENNRTFTRGYVSPSVESMTLSAESAWMAGTNTAATVQSLDEDTEEYNW